MKDIVIWIAGIAAYTAAVYLIVKWVGKACDRTCPTCKGSGLDAELKWPDGSAASCETCEGYGKL